MLHYDILTQIHEYTTDAQFMSINKDTYDIYWKFMPRSLKIGLIQYSIRKDIPRLFFKMKKQRIAGEIKKLISHGAVKILNVVAKECPTNRYIIKYFICIGTGLHLFDRPMLLRYFSYAVFKRNQKSVDYIIKNCDVRSKDIDYIIDNCPEQLDLIFELFDMTTAYQKTIIKNMLLGYPGCCFKWAVALGVEINPSDYIHQIAMDPGLIKKYGNNSVIGYSDLARLDHQYTDTELLEVLKGFKLCVNGFMNGRNYKMFINHPNVVIREFDYDVHQLIVRKKDMAAAKKYITNIDDSILSVSLRQMYAAGLLYDGLTVDNDVLEREIINGIIPPDDIIMNSTKDAIIKVLKEKISIGARMTNPRVRLFDQKCGLKFSY